MKTLLLNVQTLAVSQFVPVRPVAAGSIFGPTQFVVEAAAEIVVFYDPECGLSKAATAQVFLTGQHQGRAYTATPILRRNIDGSHFTDAVAVVVARRHEAAVALNAPFDFSDKKALGRLTKLAFATNDPLPAFDERFNACALEVVRTEDVAVRGEVTINVNASNLLGIN
jgi:hypothetical protein